MILEQSEILDLVGIATSIPGTSDYSSVRGEIFSGFDSRLRGKLPLKTEDMNVESLCHKDLTLLNQCEVSPGSPHPLVLWLAPCSANCSMKTSARSSSGCGKGRLSLINGGGDCRMTSACQCISSSS